MKIQPNVLSKKLKYLPKINRTYLYKLRNTQKSPGRKITFITVIEGWNNFTPYKLYRFRLDNGTHWEIFNHTFHKAFKKGRVRLLPINYENSSLS